MKRLTVAHRPPSPITASLIDNTPTSAMPGLLRMIVSRCTIVNMTMLHTLLHIAVGVYMKVRRRNDTSFCCIIDVFVDIIVGNVGNVVVGQSSEIRSAMIMTCRSHATLLIAHVPSSNLNAKHERICKQFFCLSKFCWQFH
jgi:hypothetical protein